MAYASEVELSGMGSVRSMRKHESPDFSRGESQNLSTGDVANLSSAMQDPRFHFVRGDLPDTEATRRALADSKLVFHLAADAEVRAGAHDPDEQFKQNLQATYNLLETTRRRATPTRLVFASTYTIYGEAT
ncbi:MAG: GDP-mannose 4,6-dehydratase [Candidatus Bathyarchaeia archaeon]